jgi:hypothetical protein
MAGAGKLVDGKGVTVAHGASVLSDLFIIDSVEIPLGFEATEIDLTGTGNTAVETGKLSTIRKVPDITINVVSDPVKIAALPLTNAALVITLPTATPTVCTFWAQLKSVGNSTVKTKEKGMSALVYKVTNLNGSDVETAPTIV